MALQKIAVFPKFETNEQKSLYIQLKWSIKHTSEKKFTYLIRYSYTGANFKHNNTKWWLNVVC